MIEITLPRKQVLLSPKESAPIWYLDPGHYIFERVESPFLDKMKNYDPVRDDYLVLEGTTKGAPIWFWRAISAEYFGNLRVIITGLD